MQQMKTSVAHVSYGDQRGLTGSSLTPALHSDLSFEQAMAKRKAVTMVAMMARSKAGAGVSMISSAAGRNWGSSDVRCFGVRLARAPGRFEYAGVAGKDIAVGLGC